MSINVQFFASLREQIGQSQIILPYEALPEASPASPLNVLAVWTLASNDQQMPANTLCAINMEYVKPEAEVNDGDEVAFFPPVTGG